MTMSKDKVQKVCDQIASLLKKLSLDCDLNRREGSNIAHVTDELNDVRESYVNRKLRELKCPSTSKSAK